MADPRTKPVDIPGTEGPSVRSTQAVPLEAPQVRAASPVTGFDGMARAFAQFFGQAAQGLQAVSEGARAAELSEMRTNFQIDRAEAEKENRQNKVLKTEQAAADALAGRPMDPAQAQDFDYAHTYSKAAGEQHGHEMQAQWFQEVYSQAKPGDNLMALTDEWLKNNWGTGTGNPTYDAQALAKFKSGVDRAVLQFGENSVKSVIATGLQNQDANVAAAVKDGSIAGKMQEFADSYRKLDPANPEKAPLRLAQAIQNSIFSGDPRVTQGVLSALEKPGTGVNGKSYAESFPGAYKDIQEQLTSHYMRDGSLQGSQAYSDLSNRLIEAKGDPAKIAEIGKDLETKVFPRFGGSSKYLELKGHIATQLASAAKVGVAINQIDEMVQGSRGIDPKPINEHFMDYLAAKGVDPREQPEQAGALVAKLGVQPAALKADMSQLMLNTASPEGQLKAIRYFDAISGSYNDPYAAKRFMNDDAAFIYDAIGMERGQNLPQALDRVNQNLDALHKAKAVSWNDITGSKDGEVTVKDAIDKSVRGSSHIFGLFGHTGAFSDTDNTTVDWGTQQMLMDQMKTAAILGGRGGQSDIQKLADQAFQNAAATGKLEVVPGEDGSNVIRPKRFGDFDSVTGQPLVHLGGSVLNPATRKPENTLDTFRNDIAAVGAVVPGLIDDPAKISVAPLAPRGIDGKAPQGSDGVYWLQRSGSRMTILFGEDLDIGGQKMTVPTDPAKAAEFLKQHLPTDRGIVIVPNSPSHPTAFWVGYRAHFTGKSGDLTDTEMLKKRQDYQEKLDAVTHPERFGFP